MRFLKIFVLYVFINTIICALVIRYKQTKTVAVTQTIKKDTLVKVDPVYADTANPLYINTGNTRPAEIIDYAVKFIGTPYVYASTDSAVGFDCSGFITFVFKHFNITVPRSSVEFTNVPHEVAVTDAKPADLILFTGTDSTEHIVGHMGIVTENTNNELQFIHASSGKANAVIITPLNDYYKGRFVKIIRIFPQNEVALNKSPS